MIQETMSEKYPTIQAAVDIALTKLEDIFTSLKELDQNITLELHNLGAPNTTPIFLRDSIKSWSDEGFPRALASTRSEMEFLRRVVGMPSRYGIGPITEEWIFEKLTTGKPIYREAEDCISDGRKTLDIAREMRIERENYLNSPPPYRSWSSMHRIRMMLMTRRVNVHRHHQPALSCHQTLVQLRAMPPVSQQRSMGRQSRWRECLRVCRVLVQETQQESQRRKRCHHRQVRIRGSTRMR